MISLLCNLALSAFKAFNSILIPRLNRLLPSKAIKVIQTISFINE